MIGLLRAEVRRFTSRRLMRVVAIGLFGLLLLVVARVATLSSPEEPGRTAPVGVDQQQLDQARQVCEEGKSQGHFPPDVDCEEFAQNNASNFGGQETDPTLRATDALGGAATAVAVVVALVAFVCAASFVGADWQAGTMQALLFWEPRRGRVLFAKAAAVVVSVVGFLLAMEVVTYLLVYLVAATRGSTEGVTGGLHMANLLLVLRAVVFVSVVALLGYVIAGLSRFTAAALGVGLVYFAVLENVVLWLRPGWERWLVSRNVSAILAKKIDVQPAGPPTPTDDFGGGFGYELYQLGGVRGAVTLGVYLAILLGAFYLMFTRRDVT